MVTGNNSYEEQTRRRLSEASTASNEIGDELRILQEKQAMFNRQISAYQIILEGYKDTTQIDWFDLLHLLTHKRKLVAIAKEYGGRAGLSPSTDILFNHKLSTAKKRETLYQMVRNNFDELVDDGIFKWVSSGEYELIEGQPRLT